MESGSSGAVEGVWTLGTGGAWKQGSGAVEGEWTLGSGAADGTGGPIRNESSNPRRFVTVDSSPNKSMQGCNFGSTIGGVQKIFINLFIYRIIFFCKW